jgi:hypothetical protein
MTTTNTTATSNDMTNIPAAACNACGGWTTYGGMSQYSNSLKPVNGRTGCMCNNGPEFNLGDEVIIRQGNNEAYLAYIERETKAMWVVKCTDFNKGLKGLMFRKNPTSTWQFEEGFREGYGDAKYMTLHAVNETMLKEVAAFMKLREQRKADADARQAAKDEVARLQKEWEQSEEGLAQSARYERWEGLEVVVERFPSNGTDRRARVKLVGDYKSRYDQEEVYKNYTYFEGNISQTTDWRGARQEDGSFVYTYKAPEISMHSLNGSPAKAKGYTEVLAQLLVLAAEWDEFTGQVAERN